MSRACPSAFLSFQKVWLEEKSQNGRATCTCCNKYDEAMSLSQAPPVILTPPSWREQQAQRQTSASRRRPRKRKRHLDYEELYEDTVLDWFDYLVNPNALDDQLAGIAKGSGKEEELLKQLVLPLADTPTPTFSAPPILSPIEDRSAPVSPVEAGLQTWSLTKKQAGLLHIIAEVVSPLICAWCLLYSVALGVGQERVDVDPDRVRYTRALHGASLFHLDYHRPRASACGDN